MKKFIPFVCAIVLTVAVLGQNYRLVPFETLKEIADRNAASLWGDVYPAEPIPYYGIDDKIVAWRFNYSIGRPFPSKETLVSECKSHRESGNKFQQWGGDDYGQLLISARDDMPVLLEYSQSLSSEFAKGFDLQEMVNQKAVGKSVKKSKIYYLNHFNTWHQYEMGGEEFYFCTSPTGGILSVSEFVGQKSIHGDSFCEKGDYESQWVEYTTGKAASSKSDIYIFNHEMMPFYDWSYGCSPTAATMLFAWYDYRSEVTVDKYSSLVNYHFERYDNAEDEMDYNVSDLQRDLATGMGTTIGGTTMPWNIDNGMRYATNDLRNYNFDVKNHYTSKWSKLYQDIVISGKPALAHISGHSTTAVGINTDTEMVITHYTWGPPNHLVWITKSSLLMVTRVSPGAPRGAHVKLLTPSGDTRYNENGEGEVFYAGGYHEIRWESDDIPGSTIDLSYSVDGGLNFTQFAYGIPNTGFYNWLIPSNLSDSNARIMVDIHTPTMTDAGADGSMGNFIILEGGSVILMIPKTLYANQKITKYYRIIHPYETSIGKWGVVGAFPEDQMNLWSSELWDENFQNLQVASTLNNPPQNLVVLDGNHLFDNTIYGIKTRPLNEVSDMKIQFSNSEGVLNWTAGTEINLDWHNSSIVRIYDIDFSPGQYFIQLQNKIWNLDLDMALFSSTDGAYFKTLAESAWISSTEGNMPESFVVNITQADRYGLCIYTRNSVGGNYSITVNNAFIWTGASNNNWHNANNWSGLTVPGAADKVTIPPSVNYPVISAGAAFCKQLNLLQGGQLRINTNSLTITDDAFINGLLEVNGSNSMICNGNIMCMPHAAIWMEQYANIEVKKDWTFEQGSNVQMNIGTVTMSGTENAKIYVKSPNCAFPNLKIMKSNASVTFDEIIPPEKGPVVSFPLKVNKQFTIFPTAHFVGNSTKQTILKDQFLAYATGQFSFDAGAVSFEMPGTSTFGVFSPAGSYFNDFEVNFSGTLELSAPADIKGDVWIKNGTFNANGYNMLVEGNWTNNSVFQHGNARVSFCGTGFQDVTNTGFWILELNKISGQLRFLETLVTCQFYDWTMGILWVNGGTFSAYGMMDPGIYGGVIVTAGELNLHQDPSNYIDLNGDLIISGGTLKITGGLGESYWPWAGNASITMSGGVLDFYDVGIRVYNSPSWSFNSNITGGTIRTRRGLNVQRTDFNPTGGTFEFYGIDEDASIIVNEQSNLYNLLITKGTGDKGISKTLTASGTLDINGDFTLSKGIFEAPSTMEIAGNFINEQTPAYFEELTSHVIFDGTASLTLNKNENFYKLTLDKTGSGILTIDDAMELKIFDKLTVETGVMQFNPGTSLLLHSGFESNYGGEVLFLGTAAYEVLVTKAVSSNYAFDAMGGTFAAEHTIFEYMNNNGVNLHSGTYIPEDKALHNCTFRNGASAGTLITWNQGATIAVQNAVFPENITGCTHNVTKTTDYGNVFFDNATGAFAGPGYENDLYSRIHWEYEPPFDLPFTENWSSGNFSANRWVKTSDNWIIDNAKGNPAPSARFNWNPSVTNYSDDLRSHYLNATGFSDVSLAYDIAYENYSFATLEQFEVRVVLNNDDFLTIASYSNTGGDFVYISELFDISAIAAGNEIRIYFRAFGQNSYNIEGWFIDNIHVYGTPLQPGKLSGVVYDDVSNVPVENALISLDGTTYFAYSQSTGEYSIINIAPGIYDATITAEGYEPFYAQGIEFLPGETVMKNFNLNPLPLFYCTENLYVTGCDYGDGIGYFLLNTIQNLSSGCSDNGYGDFTAMSTDLARGYAHQVLLKTGYSNQYVSLWVDLDDNYEFEEPERLLTDFLLAEAGVIYDASFFIPADAQTGSHRLRIRTNWNQSSADPCAQYIYGEVEDYTVVITDEMLYGYLVVTLTDDVSGDPVDDALVQITGTTLYGITEEEGECMIEFITAGFYDIEISASGFESLTIYNFEIIGNQGNYIEETLIPASDRFLEVTIFLEGPYDLYNDAMQTGLHSAGLIPLTQPYDIGPWNYPGTEQVTNVPTGVVDWVLVELRDAIDAPSATELTTISMQAAFLMGDGSVKALDGVSQLSLGGLTVQHNLFCIIRHRNHLDVMSSAGLVLAGGVYAYDFSDDITKAYGSSAGYKQLNMTPPRFGMIAGDGKANGMVNTDDKNLPWVEYAGKKGYLPGDYDLNGQVDNLDKNDLWLINIGTQTQVPDN
ncbi:MAG: carboxypeptidase regulatory-like domain-containing protein [Bacteroidales bacterium]